MSEEKTVLFEADEAVGTMTLNLPPANQLGDELIAGLTAAMDEADAAGVKVVILRSSSEKFFIAGADIKKMNGMSGEEFADYMEVLRAPIERMAGADYISIAAIEGHALGGGLETSMAATLRVAASNANLGLPETKLGILPGAGGTQRLPRLVGRGVALEMMLTGRSVDGEEAHRIGLVNRVCEPGKAYETAQELAAELAALSRPALLAIRRCTDASQSMSFADGFQVEYDEIKGLVTEGEGLEGLSAFVEKRKPDFA